MRFLASLRTVLWHSALALSVVQLDASIQVTPTQTQLAVGPKQASHTQTQLAVGHRQASHTQTQLAVGRGPSRSSTAPPPSRTARPPGGSATGTQVPTAATTPPHLPEPLPLTEAGAVHMTRNPCFRPRRHADPSPLGALRAAAGPVHAAWTRCRLDCSLLGWGLPRTAAGAVQVTRNPCFRPRRHADPSSLGALRAAPRCRR